MEKEKDQLNIIEALIQRRNDWDYGATPDIPPHSEEMTVPIEDRLTAETLSLAKSYNFDVQEVAIRKVSITYLIRDRSRTERRH